MITSNEQNEENVTAKTYIKNNLNYGKLHTFGNIANKSKFNP